VIKFLSQVAEVAPDAAIVLMFGFLGWELGLLVLAFWIDMNL
jgi:hypothetical protein